MINKDNYKAIFFLYLYKLLVFTKRSGDVANEAIQNFAEQTVAVDNTDQIFKKLEQTVSDAVSHIESVYVKLNTLENSGNYVHGAISSISAVTQQTAAYSEEVSASVDEQTASMEKFVFT